MSFASVPIPATAKVLLDERTKFSALNIHHNNHKNYSNNNANSLHIQAMTFSVSISDAACLRAVKYNFSRQRRFCCKSQLGVAELAPATSVSYGILLLGGGLFAFAKSGSKGSLFGGLTGAALMATAYILMQEPEKKAIGDALGFGSTFLFSSVFGIRLAATRKLIPAGPLLGLSICALAVFISAYLQDSL